MKQILRTILACVTILSSSTSFSEIVGPTYFPPNGMGNYINFTYQFPETYNIKSISAPVHFDTLDPDPMGTRFVTNQFSIENLNDHALSNTMYIGLNVAHATEDYIGQAHFSLFGSGYGRIYTSNCNKGADSGDGVTCPVTIPVKQGYTYKTVAEILSSDSNSTIVQGRVELYDKNGKITQDIIIGKFEVLKGEMGFTAPFAWVEGNSTPCTNVTKTQITYYPLQVQYIGSNSLHKIPINTVTGSWCGVFAQPAAEANAISMTYPKPPLTIDSAKGLVTPPSFIRPGGGIVNASGVAKPGTKVRVQLNSDQKAVTPDKNGAWSAFFDVYDENNGDMTATLIDSDGNATSQVKHQVTYIIRN